MKWRVGQTYAVQPGRTKPGIARIRITDIRQERLQEISEEDARAEGIAPYTMAKGILLPAPPVPRWAFIELWNSINTRQGTRWADNPLCWCLTFELVKEPTE
jgi:hypothetical protein